MEHINRSFLLATCAVGALTLASASASAQTAVDQTATNSATVTNNPSTLTIGAGTIGTGASGSIGATGAVSATSVTGINQNLNGPALGFSTVKQQATNALGADVTNTGTINGGASGNMSDAGSLSISSTGALASLAILGVNNANTIVPVGNVDQKTVTNDATIQNTGSINAGGLSLSGYSPSVSVSAAGAIAAVSVTGLGTSNAPQFGTIDQSPANTGNVINTNTGISTSFVNTGGGTISSSATGAAASVSTLYAGGGGSGGTFDKITQDTSNSGIVANFSSSITIVDGGFHTGTTSISASATGAVSSVSRTAISNAFAGGTMADITQTTTNTGVGVANLSTSISAPDNLGTGSSVSASATGAASSVSLTINGTGNWQGMTFNSVTQTSTNTNSFGVGNFPTTITTGGLGTQGVGSGASVSSSATGAVAAIGVTVIDSIPVGAATVSFGTINQTATNNVGLGIGNLGSTINVGELKGKGSSVSATATGAIASLSYTSINSDQSPLSTGTITQVANNGDMTGGLVTNTGTITSTAAGGLSGIGSSASISATGAASIVSVTSIKDANPGIATVGNITQSATNFANSPISNTGTISLAGPISGNGASASISATGAVSSVSFRAVK